MNLDFSKYKIKTDLSIDSKVIKNNKKIIREISGDKKVITIRFNEINKRLESIFKKELSFFLKQENLLNKKVLVVGLGNSNVTSDSLGIKVVNNIDVKENKVYALKPSVKGLTGIDTFDIINGVVKEINVDYLILIDSLKTSNLLNLNKIIQITNTYIKPGSGVNSNNKKISKETINKKIIVIGVPTVINIDNLLVSEINIDDIIDKLSVLISNGINKSL